MFLEKKNRKYLHVILLSLVVAQGLVSKQFSPSTDISKKTKREESPMSNFHTSLFPNTIYLIHHNIGIILKHNKYIFDISIPFWHHLYLSATFKPCFTWFAGNETSVHTVSRWTQHQIPVWFDLSEILMLNSGAAKQEDCGHSQALL